MYFLLGGRGWVSSLEGGEQVKKGGEEDEEGADGNDVPTRSLYLKKKKTLRNDKK